MLIFFDLHLSIVAFPVGVGLLSFMQFAYTTCGKLHMEGLIAYNLPFSIFPHLTCIFLQLLQSLQEPLNLPIELI